MNEFYYKEEVKLLETENLILKEKIEILTKMLDETLNYILGDSDEKRIRDQN
jgi:hypothetical protein